MNPHSPQPTASDVGYSLARALDGPPRGASAGLPDDTPGSPHPSEASPSISISRVHEVDAYQASVQGVAIEAVRTGEGFGPNTVLGARGPRLVLTAAALQIPMLTSTTIDDDVFVVARLISAPPGSRWCEIDLEPGAVLIYGPGTEHTGVNLAGLAFAFVAVRRDMMVDLADRHEIPFRPPARGEVRVLPASARVKDLGSALSLLLGDALSGTPPDLGAEEDFELLLLRALSKEGPTEAATDAGRGAAIDNRELVRTCRAYVESTGQIPTISELCSVASVSARRLHSAFASAYGIPPGRFFRLWALNEARRRLAATEPAYDSVSSTACDLGLAHLGRFAGRYKGLFGEYPSETLASDPTGGKGPTPGAIVASP
jgi:AraC-like DNA-binding protein